MADVSTQPTGPARSEAAPEDHWFASRGTRCAAWRFRADGDELATERGRPCVVLGHGFGATRDSGLEPYARAFAAAGLDAVAFDYPGFGASEGDARQVVTWHGQRRDWKAAIAFARALDGVDPDRICLWGSSYAGGHVIPVAADDGRIAAVISQAPAVDGLAALLNVVSYAGPGHVLKLTAHALRDLAGSVVGRPPHEVPIVAPPGNVAAMSSPDAEPGMKVVAGPTWENRCAARELALLPLNRPIARAADLPCPILLLNCEDDTVCPPAAVRKAAWKAPGRAELRSYPIGHFDIYVEPWLSRTLGDQVRFLRRHLA